MNKLQELQKWLSTGANFTKGVYLCQKFGIRPDLVNGTFKDGATRGNKKLLLDVLKTETSKLSPADGGQEVDISHTGEGQGVDKQAQIREKIKENFGMRARYPNINLSDAPDFIKFIFAEALATWETTVKAHDEKLMTAETDEQRRTIMEEISNAFEANDDAHKELAYFNNTGKILGEHPKYTDYEILEGNENPPTPEGNENPPAPGGNENPLTNELEKEFRAMEPTALLQKRNNFRSQISKTKKALETNPNDDEKKTKLAELQESEKLATSILDEI